VEVVCEDEDDDEMLFWHWLSGVLIEMGLRNMVFGRFEVKADAGGLRAIAWGEQVDREKHEPTVEVKAATFADLKVDRDKHGTWLAQCVVDV
jgi:SHS2 domain-containing protein